MTSMMTTDNEKDTLRTRNGDEDAEGAVTLEESNIEANTDYLAEEDDGSVGAVNLNEGKVVVVGDSSSSGSGGGGAVVALETTTAAAATATARDGGGTSKTTAGAGADNTTTATRTGGDDAADKTAYDVPYSFPQKVRVPLKHRARGLLFFFPRRELCRG
jgi:hypothetical protein